MTGVSRGGSGIRVDPAIVVAETGSDKVQGLTLPVYHALCMLVEQGLFGS